MRPGREKKGKGRVGPKIDDDDVDDDDVDDHLSI